MRVLSNMPPGLLEALQGDQSDELPTQPHPEAQRAELSLWLQRYEKNAARVYKRGDMVRPARRSMHFINEFKHLVQLMFWDYTTDMDPAWVDAMLKRASEPTYLFNPSLDCVVVHFGNSDARFELCCAGLLEPGSVEDRPE